MKNLFFILIGVLALSLNSQAATKAEVINNLSQNVILKTYVDLSTEAATLKTRIETLIAKPTQANLELAQDSWRRARGAYESSEGFLFGPVDALAVDPMIDTWPLSLDDMLAILKSDINIDADFLRTQNTNVLGFHAIEYVLFGEGVKTNTRKVESITKREFDYAIAATTILKEQTDLLVYAWKQHSNPEDDTSLPYIQILSKPGAENETYSSEQAVIDQLFGSMVDIINEVNSAKLPDATGSDIESANPRLEESPFSWNSINDYTSNINSIYAVYTGSFNANGKLGLKDLVAAKDSVLAEKVLAKILDCKKLINDVKGSNNMSFGQAIRDVEGRKRIFKAIAGLVELQTMFNEEVAPVLQ